MSRRFNFKGICVPGKHYMVDTSKKLEEILKLIVEDEYFAINCPRQFGKSTTIFLLQKQLWEQGYLPISISFEGFGEASFVSEEAFSRTLIKTIARSFQFTHKDLSAFFNKNLDAAVSLEELSQIITDWVGELDKELILFIDEVDAGSNNNLFLRFLGMLREKYLARNTGQDRTFKSVILAGVHDVKSLKLKISPGNERKYNSPWNIACDLPVDLSFSSEEISTMLISYAKAGKIEMDIQTLSEKLYYYTMGHPFLVSRLCSLIHEQCRERNCWTMKDVENAFKAILKDDNTNFDTLIKNLENNPKLYGLVEKILLDGVRIDFVKDSPLIKLGVTHGIFRDEGIVQIHNRVYEQRIFNYMTVNLQIEMLLSSQIERYNFRDRFLKEGEALDFELVLQRFQAFMKEQYSEKDKKFLEENGRLIFLAFIKPIINGRGFDFKEVQISEEKRLDVVITYGPHRYIVELKIWRGPVAHTAGIRQLTDYLECQDCQSGYLIIFDFTQRKE